MAHTVSRCLTEIKRVKDYLILKIQHGLQESIVKNIECESKEANDPSYWIAPPPVFFKAATIRVISPDIGL